MTAETPSLARPVTDEARGAREFEFSGLVRGVGYVAVRAGAGLRRRRPSSS